MNSIDSNYFDTPILFLVFNRPDTTQIVFQAIRKIKPTRLYVACDGPRQDLQSEIEQVALVQKIVSSVDWECDLKTLFRSTNLGCKYAVSSAISWFFDSESEGIILEDDCLPSTSFFYFCQDMLQKFRYDKNVMAITGTNITSGFKFESDYFFSKYSLMWGWASWSSAWKNNDLELSSWPKTYQLKHLRSLGFKSINELLKWQYILENVKADRINCWGFQWVYSCLLHKGLTVAPSKNLIQNIGFTEDATHTTVANPILSNLILNELEWPLIQPLSQKQNLKVDAFISKYWFGTGWVRLLKRLVLKSKCIQLAFRLKKKILEKNR